MNHAVFSEKDFDDADYVYEVRPRNRAPRCECDRDLKHGTCPGPANCPNAAPVEPKPLAPTETLEERKARQKAYRESVVICHHITNYLDMTCYKCGACL